MISQKNLPTLRLLLLRPANFLFCLSVLFFTWIPQGLRANEILRVCDDVREPLTLDPHKAFSEKHHTLVQQIYERLVRFGPDGEIMPTLATSWTRISPTVMQFKLRKDVTFHNGEKFTAKAVKFSIDRYLDPQTGFPALGFISSLKSVDIVDPYTVNIVTHEPDGLLLNRLAGYVVMVPPQYFKKEKQEHLDKNPVGTGPFIFKSWEPKKSIVLEANPNYWDKGWPRLKGLVFKFIPLEDQTQALLQGDVDILTSLLGTQTLGVQKNKTTHVLKKPTLFTIAASFNTQNGPLENVKVRRALNYAINKETLIRYDLMGNGRPLNSLTLPNYSSQKQDKSDFIDYASDPEKAKKLLKEAGYPDGFKLNVLEVKATRAANIIAAQWKKLGIDAKITSTTDAQILDMVKKGPWDVVLGSCPDPMYHPFFIHSIFLSSKSPFSLMKDAKLDSLIDQVMQEVDMDEQIKRIRELDRYVNQNALSLFTYQLIKTYGITNQIEFNPYTSGMPYFHTTLIN